jgi:hypothetical protein
VRCLLLVIPKGDRIRFSSRTSLLYPELSELKNKQGRAEEMSVVTVALSCLSGFGNEGSGLGRAKSFGAKEKVSKP